MNQLARMNALEKPGHPRETSGPFEWRVRIESE